jgi:hypothetical protein
MSLLQSWIAEFEANELISKAAETAAKAVELAELKAKEGQALNAQVDVEAAQAKLLVDSQLDAVYNDLLQVEEELKQERDIAEAEVKAFADAEADAALAAGLVEMKAQAIESLVDEMETSGLLVDQVAATKQGHVDAALVSINAAKMAKDRIAKLLANKKIK